MEENPDATAQLTIHVDFNKLRAKLGNAVDQCVRLVSIGFQCSKQSIRQDIRCLGAGGLYPFLVLRRGRRPKHANTIQIGSSLRAYEAS